jgi:protein phosphatase
VIKPEQIDSIQKNVIMQALGTQPEVKVAMTAVELCRDDCLVICSDGLSNKVPTQELHEIVQDIQDPTEACRVLVEKANQRGGEDNITVIIARFDGEALHQSSDGGPITGSLRALDRGYAAEYFSDGATAAARTADLERQADAQQQITTMFKVPDSGDLESTAAIPPPIDDDFSSRPTAERPALEERAGEPVQGARKKPGYALIIIVALISLLLIGATGFFIYSIYLKQTPPPAETPAQQE